MALNVRYVDHAAADTTGDGSSGDPWKYIWQATAAMAADRSGGADTTTTNQWYIYVKASETYGIDGTSPNPSESDDADHDGAGGDAGAVIMIDFLGSLNLPNIFEGYKTSINDGGIVSINCAYDGGNKLTNGIDSRTNVVSRTIFKNFDIQNASGDGFNGGTAVDNVTFMNCRFKSNGGQGVDGDNNITLINCMIDGNGNDGIDVDNTCLMLSCISKNNTNRGVQTNSATVYNTLIYDNGNEEQVIGNAVLTLLGCTIDANEDGGNNSSECVRQDSTANLHLINCIIYDATTGILADSALGQESLNRNCLINGCTTPGTNYPFEYDGGATNPSTGDGVGDLGHVTDAPGFTGTYVPGSNAQIKGLDAYHTNAFWASFDAAANPPFT